MDVIWSATIATTVATGMRKPRMHGMPPITSGSMVTRVTRMSIRLAGDSTLGRFSTSRLGLSSAKSKPEGDFGTACGAVSGGDAGVVALAEGVDDGQSSPVPPVVRAVSVVSREPSGLRRAVRGCFVDAAGRVRVRWSGG